MASITRRPDGRWRARYRDDAGREHAHHFARKVDGQRWLDERTAALVAGAHVDPKAGRQTFRDYAEGWRAAQAHQRPSTAAQCESRLRRHVYPIIGDRPLASILRSDVQAVVTAATGTLAPSTVEVVYGYVAAVFTSAVQDRVLPTSPCVRIRLPERVEVKVTPMSTEQVAAVADAMGDRFRALVLLAAATGMRSGELRGLTLDRIAPALHLLGELRPRECVLRVDRQLVAVDGRVPLFGPPKTPAADRNVRIGASTVGVLVAHLRTYGAGPDGLVFTMPDGRPVDRSRAGDIWRSATRGMRLRPRSGWHDLRHFHASLLIADGRSPRAVADRLGHKDAAETLRTYAHLWIDDEDRSVAVVERELGHLAS